jgi:hypothetical protein
MAGNVTIWVFCTSRTASFCRNKTAILAELFESINCTSDRGGIYRLFVLQENASDAELAKKAP